MEKEITGTILDSNDMVSEVDSIIENPDSLPVDLQYDSKKDPEYTTNAAEMREAFWTAYMIDRKIEEAFSIKNAIANYLAKGGNPTVEGLVASLPDEGSAGWYKKHPEDLEKQLNKYLATAGIAPTVVEKKPFNASDLTSSLAKELVSAGGEVDYVLSAKESANDKFKTIYSIAKTIFQGKGIKHHAFIYGSPGVGKSSFYDEKIPVRMDDAIAAAYESWIKQPVVFKNNSKTKEFEIKVGDLYEFVLAQGGKPENDGSLFVNVPFKLEIKDENDRWIPSTMVYRKTDAIYQVEFEKDSKNKIGKYAAEHILCLDPAHDIHCYVKDLQVGDVLPGGFKVLSVEKVSDKDFVYSPQADSESRLYKDVDGLIHHNTFSVKKAMEVEFPKGSLASKGYSIEWNSGDIGKAASNMVSFFYKNRQNKIIILDDCDAFIKEKDPAIQNLLKGMLDLDNTEKNPKYITTPASIRNLASKILKSEASNKKEGVEFSIDMNRLKEGRLVVSIDGIEALNEAISQEEFKIKTVKKNKSSHFNEDYFSLGLLNESKEDDDDEWIDDGELSEDDKELAMLLNQAENDGEDDCEIPSKWRFTSRLIMISNLTKSDVNDAVLSRTLSYELNLTKEEFLARLSEILPNLLTDVETESSMELVEYAKKAAYAYLIAAVDIADKGGSVKGVPVIINQKLQFRIIAELAGKWMQRADSYAEEHNITRQDKLTLDTINNAIKMNFFIFDVIPSLKL